MTSKTFQTLHTWDTKYSADSVEWCPISPYKNFFTCGTYHLVESKGTDSEMTGKEERFRTGSINLLQLKENELVVEQSIDSPGVLDMKWSPKKVNGNIALAAANAAGEVWLLYLEGDLKFKSKCVLKKDVGDYLVLSIDWIKNDSPDMICSSDSRGNISLIKLDGETLKLLKTWNAHSFEAWIVSSDPFNINCFFTGGDEGKMKVWDCRCEDVISIASSTEHKAGVTALNSCNYKENSLVSGSFDETVLFWDNRNWKVPVGNITACGGIWRLKWEPQTSSRYLLSACIYGGFQIYNVASLSVVSEYKEHESLAYGADWCFSDKNELRDLLSSDVFALIATCSFYDHKLCVSSWNEPLEKTQI